MPGLDRHQELNVWLDALQSLGFETRKLSREEFYEIVRDRRTFLSDRGITRPSVDPVRRVPMLGLSFELILKGTRALSDEDFDEYLDYVTMWVHQYLVTLFDTAFMGDEVLIDELVESELSAKGFGSSNRWATV